MAATAYDKAELTKSAELFLESWRILRNEYESGLFTGSDSSLSAEEQMQRERSLARENEGRLLLSLFALHDLARACSHIHEEYKDNVGRCKLDVYALRYGWKGNTTTEALEIETDSEDNDGIRLPWPEGSDIAHVLLLKDPLGRLVEEANSFKEAAVIIANICSLHLASFSEPFEEHKEGCNFISDSLLWMRRKASFEISSIKAASDGHPFKQIQEKTQNNSKDDKEEKDRKKLVFEIKDWESKGLPLNKEKKKELGGLIDKLHVASLPEHLIHQLKRFHVTAGAALWPCKGKSFENIREENDEGDGGGGDDEGDEDKEEERPLLRSN